MRVMKADAGPNMWYVLRVSKVRKVIRNGPSQAIKELGLILEREYGIRPLADREQRPPGYYTPNHYTEGGLRPVRPSDKSKSK
jgi:hypothetical protein